MIQDSDIRSHTGRVPGNGIQRRQFARNEAKKIAAGLLQNYHGEQAQERWPRDIDICNMVCEELEKIAARIEKQIQ